MIIANWNGGKARESLTFFDGRGHRQLIAGYYDVDDLSNFQTWDAAARDIPGRHRLHVYHLGAQVRPARILRRGPEVGASTLKRVGAGYRVHRWRYPGRLA